MPRPSELPDEVCVYRRITPTSWNRKNKNPPPTVPDYDAFVRRKHEAGISVFRAHLVTPYDVLERYVLDQQRKASSDNEDTRLSGERSLSQYGGDVEALLQSRWRVARVAESEFTAKGVFTLSEVDPAGHQTINGTYEDFRKYARDLSLMADIVPPERCRRP